MAKKQDYAKLLKDPRWQRKRLEILQRDNFTCQYCGSTDKSLHIHHNFYDMDKLPWEYDNDCLITLCDRCHESATEEKNELYLGFLQTRDLMREYGFSDFVLDSMLCQISSFFMAIIEGDGYKNNEVEKLLESSVFGSQYYNDLKLLAKLGIRHDDIIQQQYPMFLIDYKNVKRDNRYFE